MTEAFWGPARAAAADILAKDAERGSADLMAGELVDRLFTVARGGMGSGEPNWELFEKSDNIQVAIDHLPPAGKARAWLQEGIPEHDRNKRRELMKQAATAAAKKAMGN